MNSWAVIKIITVVVLFGLFIWNSTIVFKYFIAGKKVTSSEDKSQDGLIPPSLFVCREVAFTDDTKDMAELDNFFDNTLYLRYEMYDDLAYLQNNGTKNEPLFLDKNYETHVIGVNASESVYEEHFKVEHVYSYSRGLCYKFMYLKKVKVENQTIIYMLIISLCET